MNNIKNEKGAVTLVEATIVFPIVFLVVILIIFVGNVYYTRSYMQKVADKNVLVASEYIKNYTTYLVDKVGSYSLEGHDINPYVQIFGITKNIEGEIVNRVKKAAKSSSNTLIGTMAPKNIKGGMKNGRFVDIDEGFFGSDVTVAISYKMSFFSGVTLLGEIPSLEFTVYSKASVCDDVEFIRNIDYVEDLWIDFTETETGKKLMEKIQKIIDVIRKFLDFFKSK